MDKKILIVEDDPDIVSFVRESLETEGFEVEDTKTVTDALEIIHHTRVDLVILDLILPGGTGYELCKALRSDSRYEGIPIIVVTVRSSQDARRTAASLGVNEFITKPFKMAELVTKVKEHLGKQGQERRREVQEVKGKRILIVEDDADIVSFMREALKKEGFGIMDVNTVNDALDTIHTTPVDLIILDLILPKMSGYGLFKELQKDERYKDIPIIVVTVRTSEDARQTAKSLGAAEFITKPFKIEDLITKVKKYIKAP